ncbi:MAG: TolC family protein, partial [Burkholderiaceae bacterium]
MFKSVPKQLTLALLLVGVLSGCSLAPQYLRPDAPVAASYGAAADGAGTTGTTATTGRPATEIGWREFFTDARLQALIAAALDNNRDLRAAALRIEEARAQYNIQSADRLPTLNGTASGAR